MSMLQSQENLNLLKIGKNLHVRIKLGHIPLIERVIVPHNPVCFGLVRLEDRITFKFEGK